MKRYATTLLEILVVVIVVGILASLGLVNYTGVREHAFGREAQANLKLIAAAEKIYRLEIGSYYNSSSLANINANLKLALPTANANWSYSITSADIKVNFTATASRLGGAPPYSTCQYSITESQNEPSVSSGTCR